MIKEQEKTIEIIKHELVPISDLSEQDRSQMFAVLAYNFADVTWDDFLHDLSEKDKVILLRREQDHGNAIVGLSTLMNFPLDIPDAQARAIFSGDTSVLPEYRKSQGLGIEIARYFQEVQEKYPEEECHWVLISKGPDTYKILRAFFKEYYPQVQSEDRINGSYSEIPVPEKIKAIIDAFGVYKYPDEYDSKSGIIYHKRPTQRLREGTEESIITEKELGRPEVAFFVERNPGWKEQGDELVCIASTDPENYTKLLSRLLS